MADFSDEAVQAIRVLWNEIAADGHHTPDPECQNRVCRALSVLQSQVIGPWDLAHQPAAQNGKGP